MTFYLGGCWSLEATIKIPNISLGLHLRWLHCLNFYQKEEATRIKIGEDYSFIQLEDWVSLPLLLWCDVIYNLLEANWFFSWFVCDLFGFNKGRGRNWNVFGNYFQQYSSHPQETLDFLFLVLSCWLRCNFIVHSVRCELCHGQAEGFHSRFCKGERLLIFQWPGTSL